MSNDALPWKKKYLELLDKQEKNEVLYNAQVDLLKRGLIRSSLAAEGNDQQLDDHLQMLRRLLRKEASNAELEAQVELLEKAVLKSEEKINQRKIAISTVLVSFSEQLQTLQPPKEVQRALKAFEKNLNSKLAQPYSLYPLLAELKELQQKTLEAATNNTLTSPAPQGFLARLFKIREQTVNLDVEEPVSEHPKDLVEKHTETLSSTIDTVEDEQLSSLQPLEKNIVASTEDNDLFSLPQMLEPTYSSVAQHIHDTLISLMNDLPFT